MYDRCASGSSGDSGVCSAQRTFQDFALIQGRASRRQNHPPELSEYQTLRISGRPSCKSPVKVALRIPPPERQERQVRLSKSVSRGGSISASETCPFTACSWPFRASAVNFLRYLEGLLSSASLKSLVLSLCQAFFLDPRRIFQSFDFSLPGFRDFYFSSIPSFASALRQCMFIFSSLRFFSLDCRSNQGVFEPPLIVASIRLYPPSFRETCRRRYRPWFEKLALDAGVGALWSGLVELFLIFTESSGKTPHSLEDSTSFVSGR